MVFQCGEEINFVSSRERLLMIPVLKCPGLAGCLGGNEGRPSFFGLAGKLVAAPLRVLTHERM